MASPAARIGRRRGGEGGQAARPVEQLAARARPGDRSGAVVVPLAASATADVSTVRSTRPATKPAPRAPSTNSPGRSRAKRLTSSSRSSGRLRSSESATRCTPLGRLTRHVGPGPSPGTARRHALQLVTEVAQRRCGPRPSARRPARAVAGGRCRGAGAARRRTPLPLACSVRRSPPLLVPWRCPRPLLRRAAWRARRTSAVVEPVVPVVTVSLMDPPWCVTPNAFPGPGTRTGVNVRAYGEGPSVMPELTYIATMMLAVLAAVIGRSGRLGVRRARRACALVEQALDLGVQRRGELVDRAPRDPRPPSDRGRRRDRLARP